MIARRALLGAALSATAAGRAATALAQGAEGYPNRPVRVIVPYPPGGSVDVLVRLLAERMRDQLGQPFVVENRSGAGGNIGIDAVAKAAPDGHTVGAATLGQFSINQYLYRRMPFDPERDLQPVSLTWELPNVAVVAVEKVPARTLAEFIAWAKAQPNGVNLGSPGVGTSPHLSGELFGARAGMTTMHVPFRGAAQTLPALLAGDVDFAIDNLASYVAAIQQGQLRALAVTSAERWPQLPDVPTMAEAGMPDFVVTSWAGWVLPKGTPRAIVDRLADAQRQLAADQDLQQRFLVAGGRLLGSTPEEFAARAARERPMWREMVQLSGATAD
jgi:tripartite-type tricarboxylate transporter receptor subunit TctC